MKDGKKIIALSIAFGLSFWVIEAALDSYLFYEGKFWDRLIYEVPKHEAFNRFVILAIFILFGIIFAGVIAKRKIAENALRESEERFRILFEKAPDAIFIESLSDHILDANAAASQMLGYSREEFMSMTVADLQAPEARGEAGSVIRKELTQGNFFEGLDICKDGTIVPVEVHNRQMRIQGQDLVLSVVRDISQRKLVENKLRENEEKLARSKKIESLGLMAGGIAHDLNNILSGIVSYPDLLLMDLPEDSPLRMPIKTIKKSGLRAVDVVSDLLTVARGVATSKEVRSLNAIIEEHLDSVEHVKLAEMYPSVTFKTEFDCDLMNINCSPAHIKKSMFNLIANALEAIEGSGKITIFTFKRYLDEPFKGYEDINMGEYAVLSVSDDGLGITSGDLERIFEPFYTKKVMGRSGTGLGLTVVWNTVKEHEGYINVKSNERGTIFELYFPVTIEEVTAETEKISLEDYLGNGEKILVVDDEENQRVIACGLLTSLGYTSEAVPSGEEAIEYVKKRTVDLIVLDMIMPKGMNGRETYEEIIKIHPRQKAIITSGFAETEDVKTAQELGAGKYIKKPYTIEKMGLTIKEELEK